MQYALPDNAVKMIAAATYGENRGAGDDAILNTASSMFNRLGTHEWKHMDVPTILKTGYSAVKDTSNNSGFQEAMTGQFPDKNSENIYKKIYSTVASINRGTIEPTDTQFYFTQNEINKLAKNKAFDFNQVEESQPFMANVGGKSVKFRTFKYK